MIYASVCSGVEAASLAWMPLGWKAAWFSEIEPFPCEVLKQRFPDVPNLGDMTKIKGEEYRGKIDLLVGGTPCQDLSIAGNRAGFGGKRSSLALDFVRLAYESGCKWIVWENVPGVFSARGGGDFAAFLSLLSGSKVEIPGGGFATSGFVCNARRDRYGLAWRVLDAQFTRVPGFSFAVPQRRRRVFVVGYFGDWTRAAEVLLEPDRMQWDSPPRRTKGAGVARCITGSTGGASGKEQQHTFISGEGMPLNALAVDGYNAAISDQVFGTVDTRCKNVNGPTLVMATGQANAEVTVQHSPALNCNHEQPIVCAGFSGGQGAKAGGIGYEDEVAPTIRSAESGIDTAKSIRMRAGKPGGGKGALIGDDLSHTLATGNDQTVVYTVHGAQTPLGISEDGAPMNTVTAASVPGVGWQATVRRLLPIECERLMGFTDNWTRISWRGKPEEKCPDSHRYKACGNSMCVNVMRWIGMRIEQVEREMK